MGDGVDEIILLLVEHESVQPMSIGTSGKHPTVSWICEIWK